MALVEGGSVVFLITHAQGMRAGQGWDPIKARVMWVVTLGAAEFF